MPSSKCLSKTGVLFAFALNGFGSIWFMHLAFALQTESTLTFFRPAQLKAILMPPKCRRSQGRGRL